MNLSKELLEKAKAAKSVEELLTLAKENGIALSEEEAKKYFAEWSSKRELADEELNNVSGGCGGGGGSKEDNKNDDDDTQVDFAGYAPGMPCPMCGATLKNNHQQVGTSYQSICPNCNETWLYQILA